MKLRIGIIYGGCSVEHEVSIITAVQAMEFVDRNLYEVVPIYISKEGTWYTGESLINMSSYKDMDNIDKVAKQVSLVKKDNEFVLLSVNSLFNKVIDKIDVAIPIVHGKGVEDGSLSGYLSTIGIPYAGPKMLGASIGQDKAVQKMVLSANGINVPKYFWFYDYEFNQEEERIVNEIEKINYPVIVKPANLGSSIGISFAKDRSDLIKSITEAITYDNKIVVEEVIKDLQEVDCAVLGNHEHQTVAPLGEVLSDSNFFTFDEKYLASGGKSPKGAKTSTDTDNASLVMTGFRIPAKISKKVEKEIIETSIKVFKLFDLSGVTRFDYLVDTKNDKIYLNEPNTIPGCMAFFFFNADGKNYTQLLTEMIKTAIKDYKVEIKRVTNFDSNILSTYEGGNGAKSGKINPTK